MSASSSRYGLLRAATLSLALVLTSGLIACSDDDNTCTGALCQPDASTDASGPDSYRGPDLDGADLRVDSARADAWTVDGPSTDSAAYVHEDISVQTLDQWIKASKPLLLIDVREPSELPNTGIIAGTINKPWTSGVLQTDYAQLPKDKPIVLICASGNRSNQAATFIAAKGFMPVYDMLGGMAAWKTAGLPTVTP